MSKKLKNKQMYPKIISFNISSLNGEMDWVSLDYEAMTEYYTKSYKWKVDAVLIGSNSLKNIGEKDKTINFQKQQIPESFKKIIYYPLPKLIITDSKGKINNWNIIQSQPWFGDIVVLCSKSTSDLYIKELEKRNIKYIREGEEQNDIKKSLEILKSSYNIKTIRSDCGKKLRDYLIEEKLISEFNTYFYPKYITSTKNIDLKNIKIEPQDKGFISSSEL